MKWWKNESGYNEILPEDIDPEEAEEILRKFADEIVKRRLTTPAIFILESSLPLNFIGSQSMIALEPFVHAIFNMPNYHKFALLIESDENVKKLITMIEDANYEQKKQGK